MRRRLRAALAAVGVPLALLTAGCTALGGGSSTPSPSGGAATTLHPPSQGSTGAASGQDQASDPANARFYDQKIAWTSCGSDGLQCARVSVPVDWSAPAGATLQIALDRYRARDPDARIGSLLFDPGGPGVSGTDYVAQTHGRVGTTDLADHYDIVGLDPRGVGSSSPLECLGDADLDAYLSRDVDPDTAPGFAELTARSNQFAQGCARDAGALLGHVGTLDAARDMDVVRAALGEERLDYLGVSYGTLLGATYAGLFPHRVGRFVLDGALDPASSLGDVSLAQAKGLESELHTYAAGCRSRTTCTLSHDPTTAVAQIRSILRRAQTSPLPTGTSRPLTQALATTGVIAPLYDDAAWPALDDALDQARHGNGRGLLSFADSYDDRSLDGTYTSNELQAFTAITCVDYPVSTDVTAMRTEAEKLQALSPTFGESLAYYEVQCDVWPVRPTRTPAPIRAAGAPPILVVGNRGDPITPYPWARALASQLASGRLLTWDGEGHASYNRGSACIDGAVDGYLVRDVLPGVGATCAS